MRLIPILLALATVLPMSGCGRSDGDRGCSSKSSTVADMTGCRYHNAHGYTVSARGGSIYVHKNDLLIRADKAGTASIHPDTTLTIDGDDVPVTEAAHKALNGYRAAYKALAEDAISLRHEGLDLGLRTMGAVMKGLLDDQPDDADSGSDDDDKDADRRGEEISKRALGLCSKLSALRVAQQNVVDLVPKFADYAVIEAGEVKDCYDDNWKDADKEDRLAKPTPPLPPTSPTPPPPPTPPSPPKPSMSFNINMDSGNWSVHHGAVVIPLDDGGDDTEATVSGDGSLHIGDRAIDISSSGREALVRFHHNALKVEDAGVGLGLAGVDIALGAVGSAIHGVFGGDTDKSEKELEHRGAAMNVRVKQMCGYLRDMRTAQQDAVAAIPEFKPYAVVTEKGVRECGINKDKPKDSKDGAPAA